MRLLILCTLFLLASCSSIKPGITEKDEGPVSIITGKTGGTKLSDITGSRDDTGSTMPVNAILWRASLEILSLIPISEVDTFSGTIVSDWHSLPENQNERLKVTIFVLDRELRSDAIKAVIYIQKRARKDAPWGNTLRDKTFARKIEDLILNRAREIRAAAINDVEQ
tara:strand:- start:144 stop:644 length:501 start_codon:yes stop_codon:yes gene_type:complete